MAKEFFKDLPNTTTPLTASRLNGLLDGEEPMGNLVVDSIRTKNIVDYRLSKNGAIPTNSTSETLDYNIYSLTTAWFPCKPNTTYTISGGNNRRRWQTKSENGTITYVGDETTFTTNSSAKYLRVYYYYGSSQAYFDTIQNLQVEEGSTATAFSEYQNLNPYTNNYSTGEIVVGRWIDGKPLYRKVINFGNLPNNTTGTVAHNISNYDDVIKLYGVAKYDTFRFPIPQATNQSSQGTIGMWLGASTISIRTTTNMSNYTAYVVVEYTKTTD